MHVSLNHHTRNNLTQGIRIAMTTPHHHQVPQPALENTRISGSCRKVYEKKGLHVTVISFIPGTLGMGWGGKIIVADDYTAKKLKGTKYSAE